MLSINKSIGSHVKLSALHGWLHLFSKNDIMISHPERFGLICCCLCLMIIIGIFILGCFPLLGY
jgi:hypothetical protein